MKLNVLLILTFLIIFIPSVEATITNPSFETGSLTPWVGYVSYSGEVSIVTSPVYDGNYSAKVRVLDSTSQYTNIYQTGVDLTGVDELTFMLWCSYVGANIAFYVDSNHHSLTSPGVSAWTEMTVDVSSYSGTHTIKYQISNTNNAGYKTTYVDAFKLDGVGWNPTLSGTVNSSLGGPIDGASVSIHDDYGSNGSKTAITNSTGYYEITNITSGIWRIQAAAFDYDEWHENDVTINNDLTRDIEMTYNPIPTEDPTIPVIIAIPPISWWEDRDTSPETSDEAPDKTIIDDIKQFIDNVAEGMQTGIEDVIEGMEDLMEPIIEPIQSTYEEITHTTETSSFLFILFAYFGALVASLLLFYTSETEIDIPTILLSGTIGWILPLLITFSGIISLVFTSGILTGLVFAIFGFVSYIVFTNLSSKENVPGGTK